MRMAVGKKRSTHTYSDPSTRSSSSSSTASLPSWPVRKTASSTPMPKAAP